jgi:hypothetical protein
MVDTQWNKKCSSRNKSFSVSEFEPICRKNSKKKSESNSDSSHQSVHNGLSRTQSVNDAGNNSKVGSKIKSEAASNAGIIRRGSSKKVRKTSTNEELPSDMLVMSKRRQQRIQINTNLASKQDEEDDVFVKKEKPVKTENLDRSFF